jgi:transcriptional regulator GlxA family with amidase domain
MSTLEKHFSPKELAETWGLSDTKIRRMFQNEPGVLLVGAPSRRLGKKLKRSYFTMRIPESVAIRVHERLRKK